MKLFMSPASRRSPRALVVDDEASIRTFAERALELAGYEVVAASDGVEALRVVDRHGPFDIFIVDLFMPHMRGDELARRLRLIDPEAKILYFTGYADRLFEHRNLLWAQEAFLEKPVTIDGLCEAVALLLFGHIHGIQRTGTEVR